MDTGVSRATRSVRSSEERYAGDRWTTELAAFRTAVSAPAVEAVIESMEHQKQMSLARRRPTDSFLPSCPATRQSPRDPCPGLPLRLQSQHATGT